MLKMFEYFLDKATSFTKQNFQESFKPSVGEVKIDVLENDVLISTTGWEKNIIVESSFDILSALISDPVNNLDKRITSLALGDSGIIDSVFVFPVVSDKTLRNETFRKTNTENIVIDKLGKYVEFTFKVPENEGNGIGASIYNEAGLYSADGTLFSRKVFTEIFKTEAQIILISWRLEWQSNV